MPDRGAGASPPEARVLGAARDSGLIQAGEPLLVMVSGGWDSVALLDIAHRLGASVTALHVNYGLREGAAADEQLVRELAGRMDVPLHVRPVTLPAEGNLQELAREARYSLAEELADGDYFGRDVNLTSRVVARARGGEVLVTDSVVDAVRDSSHLRFEGIGQVKLKGFDQPRELCRAIAREE